MQTHPFDDSMLNASIFVSFFRRVFVFFSLVCYARMFSHMHIMFRKRECDRKLQNTRVLNSDNCLVEKCMPTSRRTKRAV